LEEGASVRSGGAFFQNSVDAASKVLESFWMNCLSLFIFSSGSFLFS